VLISENQATFKNAG